MTDEVVSMLSGVESQALEHLHKDDILGYVASIAVKQKLSPTECAILFWFSSKIKVTRGPKLQEERWDYVRTYAEAIGAEEKGVTKRLARLERLQIFQKRKEGHLTYRSFAPAFIKNVISFAHEKIIKRQKDGCSSKHLRGVRSHTPEVFDQTPGSNIEEFTKGVHQMSSPTEDTPARTRRANPVPKAEAAAEKKPITILDKSSGKEIPMFKVIAAIEPLQDYWSHHMRREIYKKEVTAWACGLIEKYGQPWFYRLTHFMAQTMKDKNYRNYKGQKTLDNWVKLFLVHGDRSEGVRAS